jgi:peptidyl-prolyl cis-trans isomerase SurA
MLRHLLATFALVPVALGSQTPAGAGRPAPSPLPIDRVVAIIGDQPLLWTDVLTAINQRRAQGLQVPTDSAAQSALARSVLGDLVDEEILVQKAKEMKLEVTESDISSSADRQIKGIRSQFKSDEEYRTELRNAGLGSPEEYRKTLIEQYRRQNLQQKAFAELRKRAKPVSVTDEEVTAAFERSRPDLQKRPASVTFRQIIVSPKASAAAKARHAQNPCSSRFGREATSSRSRSASRWTPVPNSSAVIWGGIAEAVDWFRSSRR